MQKIRKEKGITLLVLVITIIILLILAGITISAITGDNGIIGNAGQAKEETEIANEKEIIEKATVQAMENNKYGNIEESELQSELDKETKEGKTEVADVGNEFEVVFNESNRYYTVDKEGHVEGAYEIVEDKYPGDITVGKDGETLDGSEEKPYEIWCIEDLCAFSNQVNKGNPFIYKYVKLMRDLNFNSDLSYVNGNISVEGNIQSCQSIEELKKLLTENEGFSPIGENSSLEGKMFSGIFDGNHKKIKNIYINKPDKTVGLFSNVMAQFDSIIIKDLEISGNMIGGTVGGILGSALLSVNDNSETCIQIENCVSNVIIEGNTVGGIVGSIASGSGKKGIIISNCINQGAIIGKENVGGILGWHYNNGVKVINCYNIGNISGNTNVGGIMGDSYQKANVINTYNLGDIKSNENAGGIIGNLDWNAANIENCYNIGKVSGKIAGGILGRLNTTNEILTTQNCYYLNADISKGIGGWDASKESLEEIYGVTNTEMKSNDILEKLNNYVTENRTKEGIELKKWFLEKDGYPIFQKNI